MNDYNIGIFDSGIGGLNIASNILINLPNENLVYFADSINMPYGDKTDEFLQDRILNIIQFLNQKNCKLILIACNTASAVWINYFCNLDHFSKVKIINIINPVVDYLIIHHKNETIGLIATPSTIKSEIYNYKLLHSSISLISKPAKHLASIIEQKLGNNPITESILHDHIMDNRFKNIDSLILGSTHYSYVKNQITNIFENKIKIIDTSEILSLHVMEYLVKHKLLSNNKSNKKRGNITIFTNGKNPPTLEKIKNDFFRQEASQIIQI